MRIEQATSFKKKTIEPLAEKDTTRENPIGTKRRRVDDADLWDVDYPSGVSEPPKKWRRNIRDRKEKRWPR